MGVITTATLIVLGVTALVGTSGAIWWNCTEEERAAARIEKLREENQHLRTAKTYVSNIKSKLVSAKEYLKDGRNDFKNGGHVSDNQPLAYVEFNGCINSLEGAIVNATNLINDFEATIEKNRRDIKAERAKLN